ncbi:MAG: 2-succinyl-5-enolpyruvyl-6-hydroxy-3-cyclohexene-1-carboxylic-acid synthase [Acidobacteriota bacterium]
MNGGDLNLLWAHRFIDGLAAAGVSRVVVSPGSRSTPLALAASRHPGVACDVIVDERSAAFFALGQARATCRPSALVCTSGTAGAHYLPAVIEASQANLPLVAVTADRPPELHERGALQTIEQVRLFGAHVRAFLDLGAPSEDEPALAGVRAAAAVAVARSLDPRPGPVHVNAPFRAPLAPTAEAPAVEPAAPAPRFFQPRRAPTAEAIRALAQACLKARRGVILAGPGRLGQAGARPAALGLARRLGFPLLAEAASQLRFAGGECDVVGLFELLVPPVAGDPCRPDLILQIGAAPTSAAWGRWLESDEAPERWVVTPHGWHDPSNAAAGVVAAEPDLTLQALLAALGEGVPADPGWAAWWRGAEDEVRVALGDAEAREAAAGELSETAAVRAVLRAVPESSLLAVANSLAIREVDLACPPDLARVGVLAQRGASGIDGTISAAAGASSVARSPVTALLGDLAFLHDVGGLAACRHAGGPLVLVVLDNHGGRIFDLLSVADGRVDAESYERLFAAGQNADPAALASAFGVACRSAADARSLEDAVAEAHAAGGTWVVVARVSGTPVRRRRLELRAAVQARLRGVRP